MTPAHQHGQSAPAKPTDAPTVLLVGNPNVGKSTLFNALTGARQHVVNAPGTTVALTEGLWRCGTTDVALVDLPGTYSMVARSPDEQVAADAMAAGESAVSVVVLDATALSRSLYLLAQLALTGAPVVVAVTMTDLAASRGLAPDVPALGRVLGVPVVAVNGRTGAGLEALALAVSRSLARPEHVRGLPAADHDHLSLNSELERAQVLFDWVESVVDAVLPPDDARHTFSDRLDRVLLSPWAGIPVFALVVWAVFQLTTVAAAPLMDLMAGFVDGPFTTLTVATLEALSAPAWLESFLVGGVLAGISAVVAFVPLMALMFAAISALEASGYLARVAVVADKALRSIGLDGRAMLPLIVGFGCNVPALSATAVLPHARQRLLAGMLVPLTSCTARLAVYLVLAQTFFPDNAGTVVFGMYVASVVLVVLGGLLARGTVMRDLTPQSLVIALPDYQWPHLRTLGRAVWSRVLSFLRKAGTVILLAVISLWVLQAIPARGGHSVADVPVEDSVYGVVSEGVAPALAPMGLDDWRIAASLVTGVAAKEAVVGALAQAYAVDDDGSGEAALRDQVRATVTETSDGHPAAASLAMMLFLLAYMPCFATLAEQRRLYGWKWTTSAAATSFAGAYLLATAVFQIGSRL
ncbi:ferrous iron transporter B [Demequina zhanjiangensis]|uniref:Ferrous iron transporter B n=1 Tax=Demequina zhanjiangensis TaxID=3051659 RepID=A0ABT8FZV2_9MICO|nr:ferrous iron transporter B [Demequina sp. SYSU T00b26]MDN4472353.1 ferrous iron transporter B [Demequina sp. SYSU T00b26]